jgi:hypothetical protein
VSTPEQQNTANGLAKLTAHINGPKHGGPFDKTEYLLNEAGLDDQAKLDGLAEWHQEEHTSAALLESDDWEAEPDPFSGTEAMLAHVLAQHSGTGTGTWLEQLDEVHEEEHRDPVTKDESGHTHPELERN